MNRFPGFPSRPEYVAIPKVFFSDVLPRISDRAEMVVTLQLFRLLSGRRGYPRVVPVEELMRDQSLNTALAETARDPDLEKARGLELAVNRGTFLTVTTPQKKELVLLNTEGDRRAAAAIQRGRLVVSDKAATGTPTVIRQGAPDIFTLYEQTVGLINPLVADRLTAAELEFPAEWIHDAFQIAAEQNKRSWAYVHAILMRWRTEGKDDGELGRHPQTPWVANQRSWVSAARSRRPS